MNSTTNLTFRPLEMNLSSNRYTGICLCCGASVASQEGFYWTGNTICSQPGMVGDKMMCEAGSEREIERQTEMRLRRAEAPAPLSQDELDRRNQRVQQMRREDEVWAKKGLRRCDRCGGAGGSEGWPGCACHECGGKGAI